MITALQEIGACEAPEVIALSAPRTPQMGVRKLKILLIEDTDTDALLTSITLESTEVPFELTRLKRGDEVLLNLARMLRPHEKSDLIILDLGLPGLDGFDVLAEIAQMPAGIREIPIVILTAHSNFEYLGESYPYLHIVEYVTKPCDPDLMREVLLRVRRSHN